MPGVPGSGGPVPVRTDQRRRTNAPEGVQVTKAPAAPVVVAPPADPLWHTVASRWFESLKTSGQSAFYEDSDWATAYLLAESMSRSLSTGDPVTGAELAAWLKGMTPLMVTEGDRRRARLELERPSVEEVPADVSELDEYRARLAARESG